MIPNLLGKLDNGRVIAPPLKIEAANHTLSPFLPEESPLLLRWLKDPRVAHGLSRVYMPWNETSLHRARNRQDGRRETLLAIRRSEDLQPVGFYVVTGDRSSRELWLSAAIGERAALGQGVIVETGVSLIDWFFGRTRFQRICSTVATENRLMSRIVRGWMEEVGRTSRISRDGAVFQAVTYAVEKICWDDVKRRNGLGSGERFTGTG